MANMTNRKSKRNDILNATVTVLGREGLAGLSASALAKEAEVSKANLFHHFSGVDEIVLEAFEQFALGLDMMDPPDGISLRDWLHQMGEASFGLNDEVLTLSRAYFVFVSKALFDETLRQRVFETVETGSAMMQRIVARIDDTADAQTLGDLIFMTGDAMAIHLIAFPERRENVLAAWSLFVDRIAPLEKE